MTETSEQARRIAERYLRQDRGPSGNIRSCAAEIRQALDAAVKAEREACAMLHEQIPNHCSHEVNCHGAGAIGAIVKYRDTIRARSNP